MLAQARATAREAEIDRCPFVQEGADFPWFTWTGTRIQRTLAALGMHVGGLRVADRGIALCFEKTAGDAVLRWYRAALVNWPEPEALAAVCPAQSMEKYEPFLAEELQALVFARNYLDLEGAVEQIRRL